MNTPRVRRMSGREWTILGLLILSIFLNYIDRGNLSVAGPIVSKEFGLTTTALGSLFSAFFWTYALFQLFGIAGFAADRYPVGIVLAAGLCLWSMATVASGFATTFASLFVARLVLGAGESVAYPCYSRIIATDIHAAHRGVANSLLDAGSKLGPALGTFIGGLLIEQVGWRLFFIALGIVSLLWLAPWVLWMPRSYAVRSAAPQDAPSTAEIVKSRSAWGTFLGHFCGNYYWFFLLTWLPTYLVNERGMSMTRMAQIGGIAYIAISAATVTAGWFSDRWIARGGSPTRVRKTMVVGGLTFSTIILPVSIVRDEQFSVALLFLACMAFGVYTSNHWAITQTLAGPLAAGRWTSVMNGIGNLAGVAAAWLTGAVVDATGYFPLAFVVAAVLVLLGAVLWGIVVGPVEEVRWPARAQGVREAQ